LHMVLVESLLR